jgi:type II secretion system protein N
VATLDLLQGAPINNKWVKRLLLPVLFVVGFLLFLVWTFPFDEIARRLEAEVRAQGGDLTIERLRSAGLTGVSALGVKLRLPGPPGAEPGAEIKLDRVDVKVDVLPLIVRRVGFSYAFEGYGGKGQGHATLAKDPRGGPLDQLSLNANDLDVRLLPVKDAAGMDFTGHVQAKVDLKQLSPPDQASGNVNLTLKGGGITAGKLMGATLPKTSLGDLDVNATLDKGVAKLEKTAARGGDIEADAEGTVRLKPLMSLSQADLRVHFKPSDAWLNSNPLFRGLLSAVGNARQPDGAYAFQITGPLSNLNSRPGR